MTETTTTSQSTEKKVFISGCYDILHAGHLQFFREAKALGTHLTVSFASADVLLKHKHRKPSLPDSHKYELLRSLDMIDEVIIGRSTATLGLDFVDDFVRMRPDILAVTTDDNYESQKMELCKRTNTTYTRIEKTPPNVTPLLSTTKILNSINSPLVLPLRVDFAGGWLDVPRFKTADGYIVNCSISPLVTLTSWPYNKSAGLGGSGAYSILTGGSAKSGVKAELDLGVGWQDPAVISETGLCVWKSGDYPALEIKVDGKDMLKGKMAIFWTGNTHDTPATATKAKDLAAIKVAGLHARDGIWKKDYNTLCEAVHMSYAVQLAEEMEQLPFDVSEATGVCAFKYLGGGFGGYALVMFRDGDSRRNYIRGDDGNVKDEYKEIEPYIRSSEGDDPELIRENEMLGNILPPPPPPPPPTTTTSEKIEIGDIDKNIKVRN